MVNIFIYKLKIYIKYIKYLIKIITKFIRITTTIIRSIIFKKRININSIINIRYRKNNK